MSEFNANYDKKLPLINNLRSMARDWENCDISDAEMLLVAITFVEDFKDNPIDPDAVTLMREMIMHEDRNRGIFEQVAIDWIHELKAKIKRLEEKDDDVDNGTWPNLKD
jgi:hypothetical protein